MRARIPFVGPAYEARSLNVDAQRAVNCYLETDATSNRAPVALYGTPGTILRATIQGPVRACIAEGGYTWWVGGNTVYRMSYGYSVTTVGTIASSTGTIGIASNGAQIIIVDGIGGWIVTVATATIAKITDADFPNGVTRAQFQDGFFIVAGDNSDKFYINETTYQGTQWNGLDFDSAAGSPDVTIGLISDHRELWLFGSNSAEIFVYTGNTDFPFERSGNTFLEAGCASGATVAKADNTVFWLGTDERGFGIVWRAQGYSPVRISNHAIERAIQGYSINDATAFTYQQEGHVFYVLNFPEATWVYDVATNEWHERAWMDPNTGNLSRWRASCHVVANNTHLVGDYQSGKIYELDLDTYTDDGGPIKRVRSTISNEQQQLRLFWSSLQVDMETGVGLSTGQGSDPLLMLRWSDDGGHSWSNYRTGSVGKIGEYSHRVKFNRLGAGRNRVFEISMTDPVKFAVLGAVAEVEAGTS